MNYWVDSNQLERVRVLLIYIVISDFNRHILLIAELHIFWFIKLDISSHHSLIKLILFLLINSNIFSLRYIKQLEKMELNILPTQLCSETLSSDRMKKFNYKENIRSFFHFYLRYLEIIFVHLMKEGPSVSKLNTKSNNE